jgi:H+-transporting ATPase
VSNIKQSEIASQPAVFSELAALPLEALEEKLVTSLQGLKSAEARERLTKYGYNELPDEKTNALLQFLSYFWGPIPWMIEVAAGLSAVVRHWEDFAIILVLLLMNAAVGFWEEYQAGNAVAALKAKLALHARVKRDGD